MTTAIVKAKATSGENEILRLSIALKMAVACAPITQAKIASAAIHYANTMGVLPKDYYSKK